jgi:hypothetical protein
MAKYVFDDILKLEFCIQWAILNPGNVPNELLKAITKSLLS